MSKLDLLHRLIYLDRDYISGAYEALTGTSAQTLVTKTESKKAGANIQLFNGELSAGESRAFSLSTAAMLQNILPELEALPAISTKSDGDEALSHVGWVEGDLSVFMVKTKHEEWGKEEVVASQKYFGIYGSNGMKVALLTTPEYFSSGIGTFPDLYETLLGANKLHVRALIRAYPASTSFDEVIVVPLVIMENAVNGGE